MTTDLVIGGIVVPGAVAAAVAGLWTYASQRSLRALGSHLAREEDAFRLAQSPRVQATIALWSAYSAFDRAVRDLVTPYYALEVPEDAEGDAQREAFLAHERLAVRAVGRAHRRLVAARSDAECLLPAATFERFEALLRLTTDAGDRYFTSRGRDLGGPEKQALRREAERLLLEADAARPAVVAEIRRIVNAPTT